MTRFNRVKLFFILPLFLVSAVASTNFTGCLDTFRAGNDPTGGTDYFGEPVNNSRDAVALTYGKCVSLCGSGQEPFDWSVFGQQFSAWLLPWLALVSQLPFGAMTSLENFISVALTIGSPTLAIFSLTITAINTRWVNDRFSEIKYPNGKKAARALIYLQQVPLQLNTRDGLLASLIVLPQNDDWWDELVEGLEQTYIWTISAASSIAWVLIAFAFTIFDSFTNLGRNLNSNGQAVGMLWLWLVPIVVGWLWAPVSSYDKIIAAINRANDKAFVAAHDPPPQTNGPRSTTPFSIGPLSIPPSITGSSNNHPSDDHPSGADPAPGDKPPNSPRLASRDSTKRAFMIYGKKKVFTQDAVRAAPVFNYARIWEWSSTVEMIAQAFENADDQANNNTPVADETDWVKTPRGRKGIHEDNRVGFVGEVHAYCGFFRTDEEPPRCLPSGMWKRMMVASVLALGLHWATTNSAAITLIFTPTIGLGCRSGTYILYGCLSTLIWLMLMLSSYLAHLAKVRHDRGNLSRFRFNSVTIARGFANFLRRLAVFGAFSNTFCIILAGVFQFSDFYSTCYCDSSVLGRGVQNAYVIIAPGYDFVPVRKAWIGALALASGSVGLFLLCLYFMLEPSNRLLR